MGEKSLQSYAKSYETIYNNMQDTFIWQVKNKPEIVEQLCILGSSLARTGQNIADQILVILNSPDCEVNPHAMISLKSKKFSEDISITGEELKANPAVYAPQIAEQAKDLFQEKRNADNNHYEGKEWYVSSRRKRSTAEA